MLRSGTFADNNHAVLERMDPEALRALIRAEFRRIMDPE
jgi:hypothetical protein